MVLFIYSRILELGSCLTGTGHLQAFDLNNIFPVTITSFVGVSLRLLESDPNPGPRLNKRRGQFDPPSGGAGQV